MREFHTLALQSICGDRHDAEAEKRAHTQLDEQHVDELIFKSLSVELWKKRDRRLCWSEVVDGSKRVKC